MKNLTWWGRSVAFLGVIACAATVLAAGAPLEYIKTRTLQNLAPRPSPYMGHYLSIDDAGLAMLNPVCNQEESGGYWEIKKYFWKDRGYTTHMLIQRGNNRFNGQYLAFNPRTGGLVFSKEEVPTSRWLIRYAGKYAGWDSFYIQSLAETGTFDMHFLTIDEVTGAVGLTPRPTPGAHWYLNSASYLPAETLFP